MSRLSKEHKELLLAHRALLGQEEKQLRRLRRSGGTAGQQEVTPFHSRMKICTRE